MRNIKLTIEYDGTNYAGWQRQNNACSIEEMVQGAIKNIIGENVKIIGCSRTDAGVHAKGYVGNFMTESKLSIGKVTNAINSQLPPDIVVIEAEEVPEAFHARYHCIGKMYSYVILNTKYPSAIERNYVYHFRRTLNFDKMVEGSKYFLGEHDFTAFKNNGGSVKSNIRNITKLDLIKEGDKIKVFISANGFLYNMVRIIVGTLLKVGLEEIEPIGIKEILQLKDRKNAGKTAGATGLCLEKVYY